MYAFIVFMYEFLKYYVCAKLVPIYNPFINKNLKIINSNKKQELDEFSL